MAELFKRRCVFSANQSEDRHTDVPTQDVPRFVLRKTVLDAQNIAIREKCILALTIVILITIICNYCVVMCNYCVLYFYFVMFECCNSVISRFGINKV